MNNSREERLTSIVLANKDIEIAYGQFGLTNRTDISDFNRHGHAVSLSAGVNDGVSGLTTEVA